MQELAINKPYRHLTVGYVRKRHEDRNTKIPKRYSVHAALSLKVTGLKRQGLPSTPGCEWVWSMEKSSLSSCRKTPRKAATFFCAVPFFMRQ